MNKMTIVVVLLISHLSLYASGFNSQEVIGKWEIVKCDLEYNGITVKTMTTKVVNGKIVAIINDDENSSDPFNQLMKGMSTSKITFEEDGTFNWAVELDDLSISEGYWKFDNQTRSIKVCEKEDKIN